MESMCKKYIGNVGGDVGSAPEIVDKHRCLRANTVRPYIHNM